MKDSLTREEFEEIKALSEKAIYSRTKADAGFYIKRLRFQETTYCGNLKTIYSRFVSSTERASGCVKDKNHLLYFYINDLGLLEQRIKE